MVAGLEEVEYVIVEGVEGNLERDLRCFGEQAGVDLALGQLPATQQQVKVEDVT